MRRRAVAAMAWLGRPVRALWPDHNPLRRTCDRVEAAVVAGVIAVFAAGGPPLALAAPHWTCDASVRAAAARQASWHQVSAVLLASAPLAGYGGYATQVLARWLRPDRTPCTGKISVPAGSVAGSKVTVWVDGAGRLTREPHERATVAREELLTETFTPVVLGLLLLLAWWVAHRVLNRCRLAGWDADWRATGPRWTRRE